MVSLLWLLAATGLIPVWLDGRLKIRAAGWFGFRVASALAVCPDFYFRPHYFLIAAPSHGPALRYRRKCYSPMAFRKEIHARNVSVLIVAMTITTCAWPWFFMPKFKLAREIYGFDPLPEAGGGGEHSSDENSPPSARVAVLGSEPEIYFLSHRHSATGYIYIYALTEAQPFAVKMRHEMIAETRGHHAGRNS